MKRLSKSERASILDHELQKRYPSPKPPLAHRNAYELLIAVLLSARSTDAMVNRVTPKLFEHACTPEAMAQCSYSEIQSLIRPCGLSPKKSKAIVDLSRILVDKYEGHVPKSFEELEALPGIGHKSASVVMAQAFGIEAFPVDTHIQRMAQRWRLSTAKSPSRIEKDLKAVFPKNRWIALHLQIIYYARAHCPARACYGLSCPLCSLLNTQKQKKTCT